MDVRAASVTGRLGPYRLLHVIGGGGMGVVHLALDPAERAVAVKVLRPHLAADPGARARLAREVEVLRRVRSPRVAEVLDADPDGPTPYVVTQFVPAPPLDAHLETYGPLAGVDLARLALGLGDALAAIHAAGVVHRDLKPANVLVRDGEAVVIDFGIAQIADDVRMTSTGLVMGTPGFLSPEVLDGDGITPSVDWWGWAATVAFAATGRPPFGGGPTEAVLSRVRRGAADLRGAPPALAAVLEAALAPDPASRPRPRHLREAVQALTAGDGPSVVAGEPTPRRGHLRVVEAGETEVLPAGGYGELGVVAAGAAATEAHGVDAAPTAPLAERVDLTGLPGPGDAATTPLPPVDLTADPVLHPDAPTALLGAHAGDRGHPPDVDEGFDGTVDERGQLVDGPWDDDPDDPDDPGARDDRDAVVAVGGDGASDEVADPRAERPAALVPLGWLTAALFAALVVVCAVAPGTALFVLVAGLLLARTIDRARRGALRRREARGPRRSDGARILVGLPIDLVASALGGLVAMILPAAMAVSAAFLVGWAMAPSGTSPLEQHWALAVGGASGLLTAWWGPGSRAVRDGTHVALRGLTPSRRAGLVALAVLLLVVLAGLLVAHGQDAPDLTPLGSSGD